MSIINKYQTNILLDEAAKLALLNSDITLVQDFMSSIVGDPKYSEKIINSLPLTTHYVAIKNQVVDIKKIREQISNIFRDVLTASLSLDSITSNQTNYLEDLFPKIFLAKSLAARIKNSISTEKAKLSTKSSWAFNEDFSTTFYTDLENSTIDIDTSSKVVTLRSMSTIPDIQLASVESTVKTPSTLNSGPQSAFDGSLSTAWQVYFTDKSDFSKVVIKFNRPTNLSSIKLDPIGVGLKTQIQLEGQSLQSEITEVIYTKTTIPLSARNVVSITITISNVSSVLPKLAGLRDITFLGSGFINEGLFISKEFEVPTFSQIRLEPNQVTPANTSLTWEKKIGSDSWTNLDINQWISVESNGIAKEEIIIGDLQTDSALYAITLDNPPSTIGSGKMYVGVNQFIVEAQKTFDLANGDPLKIPSSLSFIPTLPAWADPSVTTNTNTASGTECPVQLQNDVTTHSLLKREGALVGTMSTPAGEGLIWLPVCGQSSLQKDYHYRFKTRVFCEDDVLINDATYWFIQGFKPAGSKTFKQSRRSLGSFSFYVNGLAVCGDNYPDTLYSDGTCDSKAASGNMFSFALQKGWNTLEYHLYFPTLPSYLKDDESESDYCQLVITPNIFHAATAFSKGITEVVSLEPQTALNNFDLTWKAPRSLQYWAWSAYNSNTVVFNTNKSNLIDKIYGGNTSYSLPNLTIFYDKLLDTDSQTLKIRAKLSKTQDSLSSPINKGYNLFVK